MARGARTSPTTAPPIPKPSFRKIEDVESTQPGGVHDQQARSYGYNDFSDFQRPDHYIRHIEPLEIDLARQVEYDMDEQDKEWLDHINTERKKEQLDKVSYETFEILMDRLEKEWFDLTKNLPKPDLAMPSEDSTCAICDDSEGENSNAIVFCDGCNLAVHQDCYGVPYIPEGQWLCRKCTVSPENPVSCILCPNEGGAFKQTTSGEWVHLLCALWVPETRVMNEVFMEPITGVEKVSKQRWKLRCTICEVREGACIQCVKTSCFLAFHTTCARKEKLLLPMKGTQGSEPGTLTCYCERHLPKAQQEIRSAALQAEDSEDSDSPAHHVTNKNSKSARAYAKSYTLGPPLVPTLVVNRLIQYISKVVIRKKQEFVMTLCRYWSLKREARRGVPLLKRLHLEPWGVGSGSAALGGANDPDTLTHDKEFKLSMLQKLRQDLEHVQELTILTRKRESRKLRQAKLMNELLTSIFFPHERPLQEALNRIENFDRQDYFKNPIILSQVPDYLTVVSRPMCWLNIEEKLAKHEYWSLEAFKEDVTLVLENAILYNKPGTPYHKAAQRIKGSTAPILEKLNDLSRTHEPIPVINPEELMDVDLPLGDLEPTSLDLQLLALDSAEIMEESPFILKEAILDSLASYEFAVVKPPPPPPPPKAPKQRRDRQGGGGRRKSTAATAGDSNEAGGLSVLRSAPRTRGARAAAAAFEAEAAAGVGLDSEMHGEGPPNSAAETETSEQLGSSAVPSSSRRGAPKKRPSTSTSNLVDPPLMISDVGNRDSFKLFDQGWILPANTRRGGRTPAERGAGPPPKKRVKHEHTATPTPGFQEPGPSMSRQATETLPDEADQMPMDVDAGPSTAPIEFSGKPISSSTAALDDDTTNIVQAPNGTTIIEKLDTPAIRKQKHALKKQQKLSEQQQPQSSQHEEHGPADEQFTQLSPTAATQALVPPPPDSDLSSLSDSEVGESAALAAIAQVTVDAEDHGPIEEDSTTSYLPLSVVAPSSTSISRRSNTSRPSKKKKKLKKKVLPDAGMIKLEAGQKLPGGTLVWAKAATFPWWAAVVVDEKDSSVPDDVRVSARQLASKQPKSVVHIVQFYDKTSSWQFLPLSSLRELGEDKDLDDEMLAPNSTRQRWKSPAQRSDCRAAYKQAISEMDPSGKEPNEDEEIQEPGDGEEDDGDDDDDEPVEAAINRLLDEPEG
ncbi:hypothetical protein BDN72DRAFT_790358 [Pluteus cervinus]|uniref:Uncharacterized protein n=1 Tax=Pluteus cervinus TaxID=181527 RepID=A0ACD3B6L4_9AGAR|nr:hypothetical protein BDN72DRAFT_790358 [Pluteus cervinus]